MTTYTKPVARGRILGALMFGIAAVAAAAGAVTSANAHGETVQLIFSSPLPNVPGKSLSAVLVSYAPGEKSPTHDHHQASVFAFVVSGSIKSENSATGPAKIYQAGESFFEPPGSIHSISANGSDTEPAQLLAIFVADDGAELTEFHK